MGSRQSSPTDNDAQVCASASSARLADSVLSHQQVAAVQQQPSMAAHAPFEVGLTTPSSSVAVAAGTGLSDAFFTAQYMMDAQQPDYNQQVTLYMSVVCV